MNNRSKIVCILTVLTLFLLMIEFIPVTCLFEQVAGISCPACGMTRAFHAICKFDFITAFHYNILSIPFFFFIISSFIIFVYEFFTNQYRYIPKLLEILSNKFIMILIFILLFISFVVNNLS